MSKRSAMTSKKKTTGSLKKSSRSQKVKKFKISPLITIIAVIEVLVLIGAVSYAWYTLANNDTVNSGMISVAPDSGLRIDFAHADESDHINIWNYLNDFEFEAATSVDGRNIYFPTTGTFNQTSTNDMQFREGTVNDVNTKYISIDFTLTNTDDVAKKVFLNNASTFNVTDNSTTGRALRIAFYQNDNKSGVVTSSILSGTGGSSQIVYFNDNLGWAASGNLPRAYIWNDSAEGKPKLAAWPGTNLTQISGDQYYIIFNNDNSYDKILFNDGTGTASTASDKQTEDLTLQNGYIYTPTVVGSSSKYECDSLPYSSLVSSTGYAVIAPGVSTGFQRPYAPVESIDTSTGDPTTIVPAFASSIDDYFSTDTATLFELAPHETQSLSMIIWLEGTDEDCTESLYAGKNINLNLVFSLSSDTATKHTYRFLDATKENWIKNDKPKNGVDIPTVIQLYDRDLKRGFKMALEDGSTTNWTASVPTDVSAHHIEFRRVNPMDENEVWNYWDAGEMPTAYTDTVGVSGASVTYEFTAFADGSPVQYYENSDKSFTTAIAYDQRSCGGLWGNYLGSTSYLTVYDATDGHFIQNTDVSGTNGILTLKYTLAGQTIEYKGSGPSNNCYIFVVPDQIINYTDSSRPSLTFRRYYNFDADYAINSTEYNPKITYHREFSAGQACGQYYSIGQNDYGTYESHMDNYWGSDLLIIQAESSVSSYFNSDNNFIQVKYFVAGNENTHCYHYCFNDTNYKDNSSNAFASVVPVNDAYTAYRVMACNKSSHSTVNHETALVSAGQFNVDQQKWYYNTNSWFSYTDQKSNTARITSSAVTGTAYYNNILTSGNIISLRETYVYIFAHVHSNFTSNNIVAHLWNSKNTHNDYPIMSYMWYDSNWYRLYYYCARYNDYDYFQIHETTSSNKYWPSSGSKKLSEAASNVFKLNNSFSLEDTWTYSNSDWSVDENTSYAIYNKAEWDYSNVNPATD